MVVNRGNRPRSMKRRDLRSNILSTLLWTSSPRPRTHSMYSLWVIRGWWYTTRPSPTGPGSGWDSKTTDVSVMIYRESSNRQFCLVPWVLWRETLSKICRSQTISNPSLSQPEMGSFSGQSNVDTIWEGLSGWLDPPDRGPDLLLRRPTSQRVGRVGLLHRLIPTNTSPKLLHLWMYPLKHTSGGEVKSVQYFVDNLFS